MLEASHHHLSHPLFLRGFASDSVVKNPHVHSRDVGSIPGLDPWRRKWQRTPVFLPGKSQGQRCLSGYSTWGCKRVRHNLATQQRSQTQLSYSATATTLFEHCQARPVATKVWPISSGCFLTALNFPTGNLPAQAFALCLGGLSQLAQPLVPICDSPKSEKGHPREPRAGSLLPSGYRASAKAVGAHSGTREQGLQPR